MKFVILAATLPTVVALQSGYLSQLNGAGSVQSANEGSFFPAPTGSMTDLYASGPPTGGAAAAPSFGATHASSGDAFQELTDLWSSQVSVELSASQLYLSASIWFRARNLDGMAAWMLDESGEERGHGLAILEFAMKKKFPVTLNELTAPRSDWQHPEEVWVDILDAEQTNTQNLLKLAAAADKCQDYSCMAFLNPFHMEQIEAEDTVSTILAKVREAPGMLRQLDHELGLEA
jgi:ferritin